MRRAERSHNFDEVEHPLLDGRQAVTVLLEEDTQPLARYGVWRGHIAQRKTLKSGWSDNLNCIAGKNTRHKPLFLHRLLPSRHLCNQFVCQSYSGSAAAVVYGLFPFTIFLFHHHFTTTARFSADRL